MRFEPGLRHGVVVVRGVGQDPIYVRELVGRLELLHQSCVVGLKIRWFGGEAVEIKWRGEDGG